MSVWFNIPVMLGWSHWFLCINQIYREYILATAQEKQQSACAKTKMQISCAVTAQLISAFVFAIQIVHPLFYLNPKFQGSSLLLRLYRLVCVRSGRKPKLLFFSCKGSILSCTRPSPPYPGADLHLCFRTCRLLVFW